METQTTVKDLSTEHQPVSDLFNWPTSKKDWEQYRLSDEQLKFYEENGYISNIKLLDKIQIEELKKELTEITDPSHLSCFV